MRRGTQARRAEPLTAEAEAEKPTRKPPARKGATAVEELDQDVEEEIEEEEMGSDTETVSDPAVTDVTPTPAKKKTRRGSRGGKNRRKRVAAAATAVAVENGSEPVAEAPPTVTIHVPAEDLGTETNGAAPAKRKTRRGSRGGKNRRKKPAGTATPVSENGSEPETAPEVVVEPEPERPEEPDPDRYVPMSEWGDDLK